LYTIWDGTVTRLCNGAGDFDQSRCGTCGNYVEIQHNTVKVLYCHLTANTISVSVGQRVARAQSIGLMGTSGYSTGVHLHVVVTELSNGQARDIRTRLGLNGWASCE
jgi:murein DD-endopeptidase MepM/ murein hydrolase activator NlpD